MVSYRFRENSPDVANIHSKITYQKRKKNRKKRHTTYFLCASSLLIFSSLITCSEKSTCPICVYSLVSNSSRSREKPEICLPWDGKSRRDPPSSKNFRLPTSANLPRRKHILDKRVPLWLNVHENVHSSIVQNRNSAKVTTFMYPNCASEKMM